MSSSSSIDLENLPSPTQTVLTFLSQLLSNPPSFDNVPLSQPVLQRLQWSDPCDESFLYFNNMINHGINGTVEKIRSRLSSLGPSVWEICSPQQVEYKADHQIINSNDPLPDIFARVTIWESKNQTLQIDSSHKLAIILKLESIQNNLHLNSNLKINLNWNYFDLQDLLTPGLDTRPWFNSLSLALDSNKIIKSNSLSNDLDFWNDYSSDSSIHSIPHHLSSSIESLNNLNSFTNLNHQNSKFIKSNQTISTSNSHQSSIKTFSDQNLDSLKKSSNPNLNHQLIDLTLPNLHSNQKSNSSSQNLHSKKNSYSNHPSIHSDILSNLIQIESSSQNHSLAISNHHLSNQNLNSSSQIHSPAISIHSSTQNLKSSSQQPLNTQSSHLLPTKPIENQVLNSLKATFQLYRLTISQNLNNQESLSPGEMFVALAHRAVLEEENTS